MKISEKLSQAGGVIMNNKFIQRIPFQKGLKFIRTHWIFSTVSVLVTLGIIALIRFIVVEPAPVYVMATVSRGQLTQTVEAVGTIISEKDLELKFPVSGIVSDVVVDEGSTVVRGQELARLRSGSLSAAVTSARARLTSAYADLKALKEGSRPEDIAVTEAEVQNKQSAVAAAQSKLDTASATLAQAQVKLTALQQEADTALAGEVSAVGSTLTKQVIVAQTSLGVLEDTFLDVTLENILVQQQPHDYGEIRSQMAAIKPRVTALLVQSPIITNYRDAIAALQNERALVTDVSDIVQRSYNFIASMPPLALFSAAKRESMKATLALETKNMQAAVSTIDATLQSLRDTSATYDTRIASEEGNIISTQGAYDSAQADLLSGQTSLRISEAQLALKKAGTRQSDIDSSYGRVQQAQADLQKAQADYNDTVLLAPIDGIITKVNLKPGEFTPGQFSETQPAMTILGNSPYRLELYAAEIDIPKVHIGQSGSVLLDAFPNQPFALRVSEIDPAATSVDGVPKYRITLDFFAPNDAFKIGMTGDTDIITSVREDALFVPARAVIKDDQGNDIVRIIGKKGVLEQRPVHTGMETINDIEILSGLSEGEEIVLLEKK